MSPKENARPRVDIKAIKVEIKKSYEILTQDQEAAKSCNKCGVFGQCK